VGAVSAKAATRAALAETIRAASTLAEKHQVTDLLPTPEPLAPLFPAGGLARGSTLAVGRSTSLLVALLAAVSGAGSWCAVVGLPAFGVAAAAEAGVAVDRLALVRDPGPDPAGVLGALLDGFDVVVMGDPRVLGLAEVRRLAARARQRGAVLVGVGSWPGADLRLSLTDAVWHGAGRGDGRLRQRRVTVVAEGRGSAARARRVVVLLPAADGGIAPFVQPAVPVRSVPEPLHSELPTPKRPKRPKQPERPERAVPEQPGLPAPERPERAAPERVAVAGRTPAVRIRPVLPPNLVPSLVPASSLPRPAERKRTSPLRAAPEAG